MCVGYSERRSREMGGLRHVVLKGRHQPSGRSIDRLIEPNTQIDRSSDPWVDWGTRWASWGRSNWASQAGSSSEGPKDTIDDGNSLSVRLGAIRPIRALRPRPQTPTWARVDPTATLNTTVARPWVGLDGRDRPGWARLGLGFRQYGRPATIDCTSSSPRCFTSYTILIPQHLTTTVHTRATPATRTQASIDPRWSPGRLPSCCWRAPRRRSWPRW